MSTGNKKILTPELEDELTNLVLSEDEIYHDNIPVESLYVLDCDSKSFGPINASSLQKFIEHNQEIYSNASIRKFGNDESVALNKHKFFTKDYLKDSKSVEYILSIDGKEHGVFTLDQVNNSLAAGNISVNDMYSIDGGKSWNRLSKIINNTINHSTKDDLPNRPDDPIFHQSRTDIIEKFQDININDEDTNKSIQTLAQWGHSNKSDFTVNENQDDLDEVTSSKKVIIVTSVAATLALTIFSFKLLFWTYDSENLRSPASIESEDTDTEEIKPKIKLKKKTIKKSKTVRKVKSKKKKKKTNKNKRKKNKKKSKKKKTKKKSKSFKKSSAYKNKKKNIDNDYYYDNDSPIEVDDARSKLSQKMIDPYSEDYDKFDNIDSDYRRPASDDYRDNDDDYIENQSDPYNYDQNEI